MHLPAKRLTRKYRASKMFLLPPSYETTLRFSALSAIVFARVKIAAFMNLLLIARLLRKPRFALFIAYLVAAIWLPVTAQVTSEPLREQLLNGLRILIWPRPADQNVLIKLRIHSGAAFDVSGKAGEMAILGDLLFPDPATREYFTEEMAGRLDVNTDYNSITVTMQGRASEFERIVEILRTALVATQLTPQNVARIRDGRIKIAKETPVSATLLADRAIAARLFGEFPYGRPQTGSAESLVRVDRADLLLARDRFLNSNNATIAVIGGVQRNNAMRALRQLLGSWRKSEQVVPATFRQPEPPDVRTLIINAPADRSAEIRLAARGLSRSDRDIVAANILATVARKRWEKLLPELTRSPVFVRHEAHYLPGMFVMGASVDKSAARKALETARSVLKSLIDTPLSSEDLQQAKTEAIALSVEGLAKSEGIAEAWLDIDTFGLPPINEQMLAVNSVTPADLQRVAARFLRESPITSVVVGNSEQLKAELEPHVKVELIGVIEKQQPGKSESKPTETPGPPPKPD